MPIDRRARQRTALILAIRKAERGLLQPSPKILNNGTRHEFKTV